MQWNSMARLALAGVLAIIAPIKAPGQAVPGPWPEHTINGDADFPSNRGVIDLAPNSLGADRLTYFCCSGDGPWPDVQVGAGRTRTLTSSTTMELVYLGYNGDGSWLVKREDTSQIFVFRGNTLTKSAARSIAETPAGLNNPSPVYTWEHSPKPAASPTVVDGPRSNDPNLPSASGGWIALAPNAMGQTVLAYAWTQGIDTPPFITVSEYHGTLKRNMSYMGYNDQGTWIAADSALYVLKGDVLTRKNLTHEQLPRDLQNGSAAYFAYTGTEPGRKASAGSAASGKKTGNPAGNNAAVATTNTPAPKPPEQPPTPSGPYAEHPSFTHDPDGTVWLSYTLKNFGPAGIPIKGKVSRPTIRSAPAPGLPTPAIGPNDTGTWVWIGDGAFQGQAAIFNYDSAGKLTWTYIPPDAAAKYVIR